MGKAVTPKRGHLRLGVICVVFYLLVVALGVAALLLYG